jgi:hypothetical protein
MDNLLCGASEPRPLVYDTHWQVFKTLARRVTLEKLRKYEYLSSSTHPAPITRRDEMLHRNSWTNKEQVQFQFTLITRLYVVHTLLTYFKKMKSII